MNKKFTFLCMLMLFFSFSLSSQITVGNGSNESQQVPMEPYYGYSYAQTIYLQSEINANAAADITGVQYFYSGSSSLNNSDDDVQIWMKHTTNTAFASTTDWEPVAGMTLVFSGSIPAPTTAGVDEWLSITLDTPFPYNNMDNLIIAMDANEAGYDSSSDDFHCTSVTGNRSIYYRSDNTNPDPASPPTATGTPAYIANVVLDGLAPNAAPGCVSSPSPTDASTIGYSCAGDVTLTWTAGSGASPDDYDVYFGTTSGSLTMETNTTSNSYVKTGLAANTTYYWEVISNAGGQSSSGCTEWSFTTDATVDEGSGAQTYTFLNSYVPGGPTYNFIDPVANGHTQATVTSAGSLDDGYFTVPMGITFNYYGGIGYTECHIGTNGYVSFGAGGYTSTGSSTTIPTTTDPDNMIAVAMMDLDDESDGKIYYATVGGDFVITWWHYHDYGDANEWITAQLVLEGDADGGFTIHYNETESSATIPDILTDAVIGAEFGDSEGVIYRQSGGSLGPIFCSPLAVSFLNGTVLPVELVSFNGKPMEQNNMLEWVTASEKNTEMHVIERSQNGTQNWNEIGRVEAVGFSDEHVEYSFEDSNPITVGYYRLKSVDFDGHTDYSDVVMIQRPLEDGVINVYPSPAKELLNVEFVVKNTNKYNFKMVNMVGQVVSVKSMDLEEGNQKIEFNTQNLSSGVYYLVLENNIGQEVIKFVKE